MHDEEAALVLAIHDSLHDDTVRLAYADWLDEQAGEQCQKCQGMGYVVTEHWHKPDYRIRAFSEPRLPVQERRACVACGNNGTDRRRERAELIRVQCEMAVNPCGNLQTASVHAPSPSSGPCMGCERVGILRKREAALLSNRSPRDWFDIPGWQTKWNGVPESGPKGTVTWRPSAPASLTQALDTMNIEGFVRRGFVELLRIHPTLWYRHWSTLLKHQPVTRVNLTTAPRLNIQESRNYLSHYYCVSLTDVGPSGKVVEIDANNVTSPEAARKLVRDAAEKVLAVNWPGIEFHVPQSNWTGGSPIADVMSMAMHAGVPLSQSFVAGHFGLSPPPVDGEG